ncbi:MAG: sulfotransferase domain-containing protein [Polyangiales bacterium]
MQNATIDWPRKRREVQNHHADSRIWNDFRYRDDDIVIATYAKSGTTWMQQIVSQLLFNGAEGLEVARMSPCLELRVPPPEVKLRHVEAQTHRRFLKTHLPVDGLVFVPKAKYIHVARDGRDVVWSMHNHHANANALWYETMNDTPGRVGHALEKPTASVREYFIEWLERDGYPFWPFWAHARSWWSARQLPNVLMLHYEELKRDLSGQIRKVARFLDVPVDQQRWQEIVHHCSFEYMKANATKSLPMEGAFWDDGSRTFVNKGVNGRWREVLSRVDVERYEARAERELGPECARWFASASRS